MAICGLSKSRNLLARKRLLKRETSRRVLLENLEARQLLAVGPQLLGVQPNAGDLLENGEVLQVSPRELVFRFDDAAGIDPTTLDGIRVIRSGEDGLFERASVATDFGTNGQTLVEFYAQQPGEVGNGIELRFTSVTRNDNRNPVIRVNGRVIDVELNSNPILETRVEDVLQAFDAANQSPATSLVYALRLRGSQTVGIGRSVDTTRPYILSGANSAKTTTDFGIGNSLAVRLVARDSGNAGLGLQINVTERDRGGSGNPIVSVVGKTIDVELNSNPRHPTTVQEFIDALNANDSQSSALLRAELVSGSPAIRIGSAPIGYSPLLLAGVSDIEIVPAYVGLGDTDREVILRFAETLPDDQYRLEILGQGNRTLRNVNGEAFNNGVSRSVAFELDLGAQIESVVPQPISRDASGALVQNRNRIDIYFNDDDLIDVRSIASVNGIAINDFLNLRTPLFLQSSDVITFFPGATGVRGALDPNFYQLFHTADTLDNSDDVRILPTSIRYYPGSDRAELSFNRNLDELTAPGTNTLLGAGQLRLRVGSNEAAPLAPTTVDGLTNDPADTFAGATDLGSSWTPGVAGSQSVIIDSEIDNTTPLVLDFPGGSDEPGNRQNRFQDNLRLGADSEDGTSIQYYNFQNNLGVFSNTNLLNAITEQQKERVREVFSLYEQYLGVRFVESATLGMTVAVGDTRAVVPFEDVVGSGNPGVIELNGPGLTTYESGTLRNNGQLATVLDIQDFSDSTRNEFAGPFQRSAMQGVGRLLGLGLADEVAQLTIQSFDSVFAPGVGTETVLPGDADILHGQFLYRPDSKDIDLYQFSLPVDGQISIEAFAERMSEASLLDSQILLYQQNSLGGWDQIAANDDYYSSDSYLELDLQQGNYIVGVSASGNADYDPTIADTGIGGRSEGRYQLRMDFRPPAQGVLRDGTGTAFDGDADGSPDGVFNFWFRPSGPSNTKFVDKATTAGVGNGTLSAPYANIGAALAAAQPGDVVRIVGNSGADNDWSTQGDNLAYEIGFDNLGRPLPDGSTFDVPKDVAVVIDAGAILKMRRSRIGVGSTSVNVDRSGGSLMVLGTPNLVDSNGDVLTNSAGEPISGNVYITSVNDGALGQNANPNVVGSTPTRGDWGGLDFRNRVDSSFAGRTNLEELGQFLNWVSHADVRYGGGQVVVDGVSQAVSSVQMVDARPTITYSSVTSSSDAAISATPNSFLETNFHSPAEQGTGSFTVDYDRVGPELNNNRLTGNSINGLQIRVRTPAGTQLEKMTVQGRFDDTDVVHYIPENLEVQGTPGGAVLINEGPSSVSVILTEQVGGTLPFGIYNYRFTSLDNNGVESAASEPTSSIFAFGSGSIVLSNLPLGINRIYRSTGAGTGPYELIAEYSSNTSTFVDDGTTLGTILSDNLARFETRLDARLAIDPGTIIKSQGARIDVDMGAQLIAEGADGHPIVFTSLRDARYGAGGTFDTANQAGSVSAAAGDWGGIYVGHTSKGSLDHTVIAFGGGTTRVEGGFSDFNALEVHQGDLRLTHSRIENSGDGATTSTDPDRGGRGTNSPGAVFVRGAQPIIVDNVILNNLGPAISANVSSLNHHDVDDYGRSTGRLDRYEAGVNNKGPLIAENRLDQNELNGMQVRGGNLTTEGWWDDSDVAHIVLDEIVVPDYHGFGGLRLASASDQSLVVKLDGPTAGFTATGTPLDNANRIGGSVQVIGQPGFPVILTSLSDNTVGAGFTLAGNVQSETAATEAESRLPTGPEVNNGTLIDNDVDVNTPGFFSFDVGPGGSANFGGAGGITAQGNTQLFVNLDVIFDFLNYVDVGADGNALNLANTNITLAPTLVAPDLVASEGNFAGANGTVNWRVESRMENGDTRVFNTVRLTSDSPLGDIQVINYLDEDVQGISDDILYQTGTPGQEDFLAFTLDGPERIGFAQGGVYSATAGLLENATYEGWAADAFRELAGAIETTGTTYSVAGNIDTTSLAPFTDAQLGDVHGPADVTTAFAWRVAPTATEAVVTGFLELVPRNPATAASAGDWRSVLLDTYSNDRNVAVVPEVESPLSSSPSANDNPFRAQMLGGIAPNEKAGDENNRLGFQVEGVLSKPSDVDVYSFRADAGTEVWLDIDRTNNSLDTVIELVDANGRTLALSDDSLLEEADPSLLYRANDLAEQSVNPLRKSSPEFYFQSAQGQPKDLFSTNPKDAGLRVRLPGETGSNNLYHIRVRSSSLNAGDPASNLLDPSLVTAGLTRGGYQLQVRLSEVDEVPGSSLTYADIRFATNGLELVGVPGNSPLLGENSEVEIRDINGDGNLDPATESNDTFANAQALGNLLQTNRQAISVAGNLDNFTDVDWFSFDLNYAGITPTALREYFSTIIDVDYADGIGRPDTSLYVFDANGNLILGGLGSGLVDDQASPANGADNSDLSRGSAGQLDPYIGSYELAAGRYFLAITNSDMVPAVLATYTDPNFTDPEMRLQPIEGIQLIAEDHISFQGGSAAVAPVTPILFPKAGDFDGTTVYTTENDSIVDFDLNDIALYVSQDVGVERTNVYIVNPFTGEVRGQVGRGNFDVQDIDFRPNGQLRGYDRAIEDQVPGNVDRDTLSNYIDIDPGTAQFTNLGPLGLQSSHLEFDGQGNANAVASDDGFNVEALTFAILGGQERGLLVANRPTPPGFEPQYITNTRFINNNGQPGFDRPGPSYFSNVIYEFNENTGAPTSAPAANKMNLGPALGAGSAIRERGYIETFTLDALGNIVSRSSQLLAREVTASTANSGAVSQILDGDVFIVEDGGGFQTRFEFDLGPEVLVNYDPANGLFVRDGMEFMLDGVTYEFDTGNVVVVTAFSGSQLADGSTVRVFNAGGVERIFEFDNNNQVVGGSNVRVPFTPTTTQAGLVQALATAINSQAGFGVEAQFNANSGRLSLLNTSLTEPIQVTGTGLTVDGVVGSTPGNVRIAISEAATLREFITAISENAGAGITVSFEGGRMNFSGANLGDFTDLVNAGIFTDVGSTGAVAGGNVAIRVLASDTAETVAARIVQAINASGIPNLSATANGEQVQLGGVVIEDAGPLAQTGVAPGGIVTGIAVIGNRMYAVSDAGGLYTVDNPTALRTGNVASYVTTSHDLVGINFTGLVEGPVHAQNGELTQILFGIDSAGNIHAFDTAGQLQPLFANGATSISTGLFGANGLTMSSLDFNLWHVSNRRGAEPGHGLPNTPNQTRVNTTGGSSLYFGFENPGRNGVGDLTGPNSTGLQNSYNFPGGAAGALESAEFSLDGISAGDLPTLYFNYRFDTEQAASDRPLANNANDYMRDSLRIYGSGENGEWILLATNNDPAPAGSNVGFFDDELDAPLTGNPDVQRLFDNNGQWRQARVPLDLFAGQDRLKLRVEFSSNGGFGYGLQGGRGPTIRTIAGERLVDGETLVVNGQTFEIEMGPSLTLPSGTSLSNGDRVSIEGVNYIFTDGSLPVTQPDVAVTFNPGMAADAIASALLNAIQNNVAGIPTTTGLDYTNESNDTLPFAENSGITGDTIRVIGSGEIGDNAGLTEAAADVDLVAVDIDRGAQVTVEIEAATIGSSLDSFVRVFDSEGRVLLDAFGQPVENDNRIGSTDSLLTFTVQESGTYYIGVSGSGNTSYNASVEGTGVAGSTGTYNLSIQVERQLSPIVSGNRLQLDGARSVDLPIGSPITLQGGLGSTGVPVYANVGMSAAEVATSLQESLARFFAGGATQAYRVTGDVVDVTGLVNYTGIDFATGLRTPSLNDLDPGPFGATTNFVGDAFSAFNTGTNFDGTTNNGNPGTLGAQNNAFEGVYLDDFIIGVAGRGEMVLRASSNDTTFVEDPQKAVTNPDRVNPEILIGPYQFEIRGGQDYGVPLLAGFPVELDVRDSISTQDRSASGISLRFNSAASLVGGDTFTLSDGTRVLTFEMDDVNDGLPVQAGNIAVPFSTAVINPANGSITSESARTIAARVRDIINSPAIQDQLEVSANLLNGDRIGATSDTVILVGQASVEIPSSIGQKLVSNRTDGSNRERPQGQVVINGVRVSNSNGFGITVDSAPRDPITGASIPGSPRNTVTVNAERLVPGAVIMNSEFLFNNSGGISVNGDPQTAGLPAAAVPFVRLVNNTVVGGSITTISDLTPTIEGGQIFDIGNLAFADNVVSYLPFANAGPAPAAGLDVPGEALGAPNFSGTGEPAAGDGVVSLGRGGELVLEFTNNFLTGSGDGNADLMIFEIGDSEEVLVELSVDGTTFRSVGIASAAQPTIDIDAFGFNLNSRVAFVRLTDVADQGAQDGDSVGADIDAIGALSSVPAESRFPSGQGITIANNATATLLNNVITNTTTGLSIDASSSSTVVGGTVFQGNTANVAGSATLGQFPTVIDPNVPLFVSAGTGNLYPAPGSPLIDSSIDSLEDRPSLASVKRPLGIAESPILSPQFDIHGQLRVDDPAIETPSGLGENIFKDRGAQDRADFVGPSVVLRNPIDNDIDGRDQNPDQTIVELTSITLDRFDLQILDGLEPSDPSKGTGVDDSTVTSASVLLFRNNQPLVEGVDYRFGYDSTNGVIRLQPLAGIWQSESVYTIRFVNAGESAIVATSSTAYTDGDQFTILDASGSETIFEVDLGYDVTVPSANGVDPSLPDGSTFVMDDGVRRITFEIDNNGIVNPSNVAISLGQFPTMESAGRAIQNAITNTGLTAQVTEISAGKLQIQGARGLQLDTGTTGLVVAGKPGVQTVFGLQIPLEQGRPAGLADGQTFTIDRSGAPVSFEIDTNGAVSGNNIPVQFAAGASAAQVGAALVAAIDGASLGLSPSYDGDGLVRLGGDTNTGLDLTGTVLTQTGIPGQPAAVPVALPLTTTSATETATIIKQVIEAQNLTGITLTQFGGQLIVDGARGISGTGANQIGAIRDLAGNPLKPNQVDGSTTLTVFLGEGLDYGDAPSPYSSTAADNGPTHVVVTGLSLGATATSDADAKLDDADADDGVTFSSSVFAAFQTDTQISVTNNTGSDAYLSLWIDFNGDGFFASSENILSAQQVTQPTTTISYLVPSSAVVGQTYARVRLSTDQAAVANPNGAAPDGEVEDHVLTIQANPFTNASNNLDVSGDGVVSPIDVLQVVNYLNTPGNPTTLSLPAPGVAPFLDVNGDGVVAPIDALLIVNYLNSLGSGGEGESAGMADLSSTSSQSTVLASDWAPGLETIVGRPERRTEPSVEQVNDMALLASEEEESLVLGEQIAEPVHQADLAWADLTDSPDTRENNSQLYDDLLDEMF